MLAPLETLGPDCRRLVDALVAGPRAWQPYGTLARQAGGIAPTAFFDALDALGSAGWTSEWRDWPEGMSVTLTPLAAAQLGVRIVEAGPGQVPRWATADRPDPPPPRAGRECRDLAGLAIRGREMDPLTELIAREAAETRRLKSIEGAWKEAQRAALRAEGRAKAAKARRKARRRA